MAKSLNNLIKRTSVSSLLTIVFFSLSACDGGVVMPSSSAVSVSSSVPSNVGSSSVSSSALSSSVASSDAQSSTPAEEPLCEAPADMTMTDIDSMVEWINAMPKPLTLPCFIKSLPRPMYYNATLSTFSAQPSQGNRSPRVFFIIDKLVLTVVPDEPMDSMLDPETGKKIKDPVTGYDKKFWDVDGVQLLEVSLEVETSLPERQSIKGELKFPITKTLARNAPYLDISFNESNTQSVCSFCHASETEVDVIDEQPVYRSEMLRNRVATKVTLGFMLNEYGACDPDTSENEWYRCDMLEAIYGQGTLVWKSFPEDMHTIFDN